MSITVSFPGGKRVDADLGRHVVRTDQAVAAGGEGSAPEPFQLFLASLAACSGIYVLAFCQARGIPVADIHLVQHHRFDPQTHRLDRVEIEIELPPSFPDKYRASVVQAASGCAVKKVLLSPPEVAIDARTIQPARGREPRA